MAKKCHITWSGQVLVNHKGSFIPYKCVHNKSVNCTTSCFSCVIDKAGGQVRFNCTNGSADFNTSGGNFLETIFMIIKKMLAIISMGC